MSCLLVIRGFWHNPHCHICDDAASSWGIHHQPHPLSWRELCAVADAQHTLAACSILHRRIHTYTQATYRSVRLEDCLCAGCGC